MICISVSLAIILWALRACNISCLITVAVYCTWTMIQLDKYTFLWIVCILNARSQRQTMSAFKSIGNGLTSLLPVFYNTFMTCHGGNRIQLHHILETAPNTISLSTRPVGISSDMKDSHQWAQIADNCASGIQGAHDQRSTTSAWFKDIKAITRGSRPLPIDHASIPPFMQHWKSSRAGPDSTQHISVIHEMLLTHDDTWN